MTQTAICPYHFLMVCKPIDNHAGRGARTMGATASAVGPEAARRRAWGARTVRATAAAAVGPGGGVG